MKILIAPDSYKGSLSALKVADSIEKGILKVDRDSEIIKVPMADGGEGTLQSLVDSHNGEVIEKEVMGPLGNKIKSHFGYLNDTKTGVIEMALASGLPLIPKDKLNPMKTTTYGTGELIKAALEKGAEELIIGIGGSATNDAGVGMAQALGAEFKDENGDEISFGGGQLEKIKKIHISNLDPRIKNVKIRAACDVSNKLYGPNGAAYVYGPQKGADEEMVKILDANLKHFAKILKEQLDIDIQNVRGSGAAGGLGAGLVAFLDAELESGIEIVLDATNLEEKMKDIDLVITGEGRLDGQTINGKTPIGVARVAKKKNIPVIAISAIFGEGIEKVTSSGIDAVFNMLQNLELSIEEDTEDWLQFVSEQIIRLIKLKIEN